MSGYMFDNIFDHPQSVCMSYLEHLKLSLKFSMIFLKGSILAFIHAFFPDLYITSTSDIVNIVWNDLRSSGCHKSKDNEIRICNDGEGADSETVSDDTLSADGSRYYKKKIN